MQRRADLKEGMDRFTIGLFQYKAFLSFFLFCSKASVISWKLLSDEPSHGNPVDTYAHLVLGKFSCHIQESNLMGSLRLVWKRLHDGLQRSFVFLGWRRATHQMRSVGDKTCNIHESKVHCGVLARARECYAGKHVNELVDGRKALWKLVIISTFPNRKAIFL